MNPFVVMKYVIKAVTQWSTEVCVYECVQSYGLLWSIC